MNCSKKEEKMFFLECSKYLVYTKEFKIGFKNVNSKLLRMKNIN